ncbi:MAG: type II toxin-antitoxin system HicB family antitoxin [Candidatus Shapirobacteria bacterium]|jgi:predicted RNase H-like HicB family nuclease
MERQFNIVFRIEPEGGFTAIVPSLPGCVTYGKTLKHAQEMIVEAIELYVESLKKHGETIPNEGPIFVSSVRVRDKGKRTKAYAA